MSVRLLFTNSALTTLAAPITSTATTALLAAGTGALFPVPAANQAFQMTFVDAATGLVREIVQVTAMSGDTIVQMARGQEGTTASAYLAGDKAGHFNTAGTQQQFIQPPVTIGPVTASQTISQPSAISYNLGSAGVTQALPSISSMAAFDGQTVELWKSDASVNALTVTSADGFAGFGSSLTVNQQGQGLILEVSVALGKWLVQTVQPGTNILAAPSAAVITGAEYVGLVQSGAPVKAQLTAMGITPVYSASVLSGPNNVALPGTADYVFSVNTSGGAVSYTGFVAQRDGQTLRFYVNGANNLNLAALSSSSSAANQITAEGPLSMGQGGTLGIRYSSGLARWYAI